MPKDKISRSKKKIARSKRSVKPPKTIGILHSGTRGKHNKEITQFLKYLKQAGYSVHTNLTIAPNGIPLWSDDDPQKLTNNAKTLATTAGVDLIIAAGGSASVYAAQGATSTNGRPVVFTTFSERTSPANNMTGVCARTSELDVDRLTRLYNLMLTQSPGQTQYGVLENQQRPNYNRQPLDDEASRLRITLDRRDTHKNPGEPDAAVVNRIDSAFAAWRQMRIKAALVAADPIFNDHRREVIRAAKRNGIATMHQWHEFVDDSGYASYGTSLMEAYQRAGTIAGQVLDGTANPATTPVYVLTHIEVSVNRATAKRLGLRI